MENIDTLELFVDTQGVDPYYWMNVVLESAGDYEFTSPPPPHGSIPLTPNPNEEFHIDMNVQTPNNGSTTYQVLLGYISLDPEDGEIHIHLKDGQSEGVGGGIVRAEEAQEATRPIIS